MRSKVMVIFFSTLLLLGACGNESSQSNLSEKTETNQVEEQNYLYESQSIKVIETLGWTESKANSSNEKEDVIFQNGKLKAIVTVVPNHKSLEEIKNELKTSFRSVEEIAESDHYVSFKTNRKESIRTDIYLNPSDEEIGILIFMTPLQDFETNKAKIEEFKNNVQYF